MRQLVIDAIKNITIKIYSPFLKGLFYGMQKHSTMLI